MHTDDTIIQYDAANWDIVHRMHKYSLLKGVSEPSRSYFFCTTVIHIILCPLPSPNTSISLPPSLPALPALTQHRLFCLNTFMITLKQTRRSIYYIFRFKTGNKNQITKYLVCPKIKKMSGDSLQKAI